ncbi:hypothetical protein RI543_001482 [Arxiozyma heterogenica]|uniref:Aldehyde dehydrogenase domain-containing protein n=1 Tax=Arxiozyma heterogenica TaxID=278026 RepID=A0AAN8A911_9SACH|nr:hypothetical protein RI543_001482 [Kazachstania heterogenica]
MMTNLYTTIQTHSSLPDIHQPIGLFLDNDFVPSSNGNKYNSINPSTEEIITSFYVGNKNDVDRAVISSRTCFNHIWSQTSPTERNNLLRNLASLIKRDRVQLAILDCLDAGKPYHSNALGDIDQVIELTHFYSGASDKFTVGSTVPISKNKYCYTREEPYGVVALIIPWNYPFAMACWKIQGALAAGNTVIIKPSELTSLSILYAGQLFKEAGFPPGVINIIPGEGHKVGIALANHMDVDKISFTGSTRVGRLIMEYSGKSNLKDVTLECGGKSAAVIFEDSDLDIVLESVTKGIFHNSGQNCTANSRIYVHESIYEKFIDLFKCFTRKTYKFGSNFDLFDKHCTMGPVISRIQYDKINNFLNKKSKKVQIITDPINVEKGYFIPPTIVIDIEQTSDLMQQEIFGPVVCVYKFTSYEEAIKLTNNSEYGLAAMVFSNNINTINKFIKDVKTGTVWINSSNDEEISVPFGGYKMSGIGRELGEAGVKSFLQTKTVHVPIH